MKTGIHIFRKDLRIYDNLALYKLSKSVDRVIGVFVYDQKQIKRTSSNKTYFSEHAAQFIIDSVNDLNEQCNHRLVIRYGSPALVIKELIESVNPSHISFNLDFTPYALKRDAELMKICDSKGVELIKNDSDQSLVPMNDMIKKDGMPFMVYGSFFKNLSTKTVPKPVSPKCVWYKPLSIKIDSIILNTKKSVVWIGGRKEGLRKLQSNLNVGATDKVAEETSRLSAYLNHGCLSIRETYWELKNRSKKLEPIRSIAWRDFFLCIYRFHPRGNSYTQHIDERYDKLKYPKVSQREWNRFMNCKTGFLLVDAAMKELLTTGYTNNISRLILATFWIKYLMINPLDPEYGSQVWFSRLLVDCNASQNKLNHQWVVGDLDLSGRRFAMKGTHPLTGRSMRIDNELVKKYDPQFEFIKKWLPEFSDKSIKECKTELKKIEPMFDWKDRYKKYASLYTNLKS